MATSRTINRLINAVLIDILHVYRAGETIGAADKETLLYAIQDRLAAWADEITVPVATTESFSMVSGTASYTIGETGTPSLDTVRPEKIIGAYVHQGDYDYPLVIIDGTTYRGISDKTTPGRPERLYPLYTTPNITIYLYPTPDSTDTLYISSVKPYTEPTSYSTDTFATLGLPGIIYNALKWRVAIDVAPGYERPLTPEIMWNANDAFSRMTAMNLARNMRGSRIELAYGRKQGSRYTLSDFFAGE